MPNEIAYSLPRNITSMPRKPVRCLFFHEIASGRCLPERKIPTEVDRRSETEIKRERETLAMLPPSAESRRFGNRKSRNTEITQRKREERERERAGEYQAIDYERGIALLLLQTTTLRNVAKWNATSIGSCCDHKQILGRIQIDGYKYAREKFEWNCSACLKKYYKKNSIRKNRNRNILRCRMLRVSNLFIRNFRCPLRLLGGVPRHNPCLQISNHGRKIDGAATRRP